MSTPDNSAAASTTHRGALLKRLHDVICKSFKHDSLARLLLFELNLPLYKELIAPGKDFKTSVFDLICELEEKGALAGFIDAAIKERPKLAADLQLIKDKLFPSNTGRGGQIPKPPAFYAKPDYIGRHDFVGRKAQLQVLTDWAKPTDATSILLFEAIGGNGKSMLTWEWTTKHAEQARAGHEPWAGRFWYSFYEKGAIMRDFCLHALNYMTQQPMETLEKKPMADLRTALLAQLHARPWLLILDGLERVLVAYHRIDAAEVRDEEVNRPTDKILDRDPCDAIRDEDTGLRPKSKRLRFYNKASLAQKRAIAAIH